MRRWISYGVDWGPSVQQQKDKGTLRELARLYSTYEIEMQRR